MTIEWRGAILVLGYGDLSRHDPRSYLAFQGVDSWRWGRGVLYHASDRCPVKETGAFPAPR